MSVGWIPGVGTVINGLSLASDFLDFTIAALKGDAADMRDEIGDMTLDVIGMIPVIGGPLAATIYRATAPVVTPPNHAPSAVDDAFTTNENAQLTGNVLTNDTDPDGDPLTVAVDTAPGHGSLTLNANGSFTYTPAENFYGTDAFSYTVADGKGGTAVGTATITVKSVDPAPVVDEQQPYSLDPSGADPDTGKIKGHFNVTDDDPLTYKLVTAPDPTLGTFELDEQTGEWSFTPYPRTRVMAGYFAPNSPAAVKLTFAITATDGISTTAPIAVSENIAGSPTAALALPAGTTPMLSFVDPGTGDAYVFGYDGDPATFPGNESFSRIAAIIHSDGSYSTPVGDLAPGVAYQTFVLGDTTYLMTLTGAPDSGFQTHLSEVGPDGLTPIGDPIPGVGPSLLGATEMPASIVAGETTYLITTAIDGQTTFLTGLGTDGIGPTTSIAGSISPQGPIVVGDTTYLLTNTGAYDTGYQTQITALTPDGVTSSAAPAPGLGYRDPIVIGEMAYLVTQTGDYESGYETHVTALGPNGVTPTITIPGDVERDPIVIGDTTYLLMTPYSRIVTHVLALTSAGAVPVGSLPGVLSGDPIVVGDTTYLISETGEDDPATWHTWVTTLAPTLGGITLVDDALAGYRFGHSPIVVGDTTYLVTETWNSIIGSETSLTAIGPDGLMPVRVGIPGRIWSDQFVVVLGDATYLATTTSYYYPGDQTNTYELTYLTRVGPDGPIPAIGPVPGYPGSDPIVVGDTTYLVMETDDPATGHQVHLISVTSDGFTPIGDPIPGRVNPDNDFQTFIVGDTTYLVTQTGDEDLGYQTHLTAVTSDGFKPAGDPIPGRVDSTNEFRVIAVGDTAYLVTTTGGDDAGYQTHLTALGPDGVTPLAVVIPGRADAINGEDFPPIVVGDTTYLVTLTGEYDTVKSYFTALGPSGVTGPSDAIPGEVRWWPGEPMNDSVFVIGDTTYVMTVEAVMIGENTYTSGNAHLLALTPTGAVQLGDPFPSASTLSGPIVAVGDTAYLMTTSGMWAIGVDV